MSKDSSVIRALRQQVNKLNKQLEDAHYAASPEGRAEIEAGMRAEMGLEPANEGSGGESPPTSISPSDSIRQQIAEQEALGDEADEDYLNALRDELAEREAQEAEASTPTEPSAPAADHSGLAAVSSLAQGVIAATSYRTPDLMDRINAAKSPAEVQAIMAEAGLAE